MFFRNLVTNLFPGSNDRVIQFFMCSLFVLSIYALSVKAINQIVLDSSSTLEIIQSISSRIDVIVIDLDVAWRDDIEIANIIFSTIVDAFADGLIEYVKTVHIIGSLTLNMTPYRLKKLTCTTVKIEGKVDESRFGRKTIWNSAFFSIT